MTTAKKRSTTAKKPVAKRPVAKKAAPKTHASVVRVSKKAQMESFKLAPNAKPFMTLTPTTQTLYWTVIGILAIVFTTWIMTLQADVHSIYDTIQQTDMNDIVDVKTHR